MCLRMRVDLAVITSFNLKTRARKCNSPPSVLRTVNGESGGQVHRWQGRRHRDARCSACFMFVSPGSGRAACDPSWGSELRIRAEDPSWGCGSRRGPAGCPAASSSSSVLTQHQCPRAGTCGRAMRSVGFIYILKHKVVVWGKRFGSLKPFSRG